MQTFLPYPDFTKSAKCLDYRRLGKQRVEAMQILHALENPNDRWRNHPAVKMWKGYSEALRLYMNTMIKEWIHRGYNNSMRLSKINKNKLNMPWWFGKKRFHSAHRSNLLRKDSQFYKKYKWKESSDLPYWWPINGKK